MGHVIMIHYNSPAHARERQEVRPLSMEDMHNVTVFLNTLINSSTFNPLPIELDILQRLIFEHENLQHMRETQPKWISVEDALPMDSQDVIICTHKGSVMEATFYCVGDVLFYGCNGTIEDKVLWWQPLPAPPQQPDNIEVNEPENVKP